MHSVSFSSSGDRIAWVGHDSSISVADASKGLSVLVIRTDFLPFLACLWVSENRLIAAVKHFTLTHDLFPFKNQTTVIFF